MPNPDPNMRSDRDGWIFGGVGTAAFGTILGVGLFGYYRGQPMPATVFAIIGACGLVAMAILLKSHRFTIIRAAIAALISIWALFGYTVWFTSTIHDPPTADQIAQAAGAALEAATKERDELRQQLAQAKQVGVPLVTGPQYLKSPHIAVQYSSDKPVRLIGVAGAAFAHLTFAVDVLGPTSHRTVLGGLNAVINETVVQFPLIYSATVPGNPNTLWWGAPENRQPLPASSGVDEIRGRVVIIGPDNGEQYCYFDLLRLSPQVQQQTQLVEIYPSVGWIRNWQQGK